MFRHQTRKVKILFAFADAFFAILAFALAYYIREYARLPGVLHSHPVFFLTPGVTSLILAFCILTWAGTGYWLDVYGKLGSARIPMILADAARQVGLCGLGLVVLVYSARTDTSRFLLGVFVATSWLFLVVFRIAARSFVDSVSRKLGAERNVFIVGLSDTALAHARSLESYHGHGVRVVGFASPPGIDSPPASVQLERSYRVHPLDDLRGCWPAT